MKKRSAILAIVLLLSGCAQSTRQTTSQPAPSEDSSMTEPSSISDSQASVSVDVVTSPASDVEMGGEDLRIRMTFEGGEAIVRLEDNATARDWMSQLPMTQTFEDFNSIEKICRLPEELTTEGVESGVDPDIADVTLYVPWSTLVFYYEDYGWNDELIPIGHVESGMDLLTAMGDEFSVTMEAMSDAPAEAEFSSTPTTDPVETTNITMTTGGTVITATLDNSETTQEFLATLPRTLSMSRYADREYYARIENISENGEVIPDFSDGDVTLYTPGPSLAIFFANEDASSLSGLIRMGRITSDLADVYALGESVEMRIEIAD